MKSMKLVYVSLLLLVSVVLFVPFSCKNETSETLKPNTPVTGDSVCFNTQILPLFISNCTMSACHDAVSHADGYVFTDYTGIMKGITNGKIIKSIKETDPGDRMPPAGPLPATQIQLIEKWIAQGATNKICVNPCDTQLVKYNSHIAQVMTNNCLGCHSGAATSGGGINLETYTNVRNETLNGKLLCSINHAGGCSAMPKNGSKLSACDIRKVEIWKAAGYPQ